MVKLQVAAPQSAVRKLYKPTLTHRDIIRVEAKLAERVREVRLWEKKQKEKKKRKKKGAK